MPPEKNLPVSAPPVIGVDHISELPDHMLHHVLSFLPAQATVQTCVLARRWHHLWRSTTGLRIVGLDEEEKLNVTDLRKFVDHLLILREHTDLDTVEVKFDEFCDDDETYVNLWIRFAVMHKVRVLTLHVRGSEFLFLDNLRLVSRHLRTLHLDGVGVQENFLDFDRCPALEDLKINCCVFSVDRISSRSMKHLSISGCCFDMDWRVHVSTPGLVSLELVDFSGRTPFLEHMALLETAYVYLNEDCQDVCLNYDTGVFCGANENTCANCVPIEDDSGSDCVLLGGIASVKHLKLLSESGMFLFTRDLKHCPTFSKLKTLLLNEYWCKAPDLGPLACILKNTPVLEKLTLQLFSKGPNHKVEIKGHYCSVEGPSAISQYLNIVEVKCNEIDEQILKVLKFLSALNICKLSITHSMLSYILELGT